MRGPGEVLDFGLPLDTNRRLEDAEQEVEALIRVRSEEGDPGIRGRVSRMERYVLQKSAGPCGMHHAGFSSLIFFKSEKLGFIRVSSDSK